MVAPVQVATAGQSSTPSRRKGRSGDVPAREAVPIDQVAREVRLADLPDRDLTTSELMQLVSSLARDPGAWAGLVRFDDEHRYYACLHRDEHVDVWLLCWTPNSDTGWHDHDVSSGAVAVVRGCVTERNLALAQRSVDTDVPAGSTYRFGPEHIHRMVGRDPQSVTIHAYSPPLRQMGQYAVSWNGVLRRVLVSYRDELRPMGEQ